MKQEFKIEVYRNGEWVHQDTVDDVMDAYMLASSLCEKTPEDSIRIIYPSGFKDELSDFGGNSPIYRFSIIILNFIATILFLAWLYYRYH